MSTGDDFEHSTVGHIRVGVLHDYPLAGSGMDDFDSAVLMGMEPVISAGRIPPVDLVRATARGLPLPDGSSHDVVRAFNELVDADVMAVIGPAISDSTVVVQPLCDTSQVVALNFAGLERTRSEYMFHYQIGSLEDEPSLIANHLLATGRSTAYLMHDASYIGRRKAEFLVEASRETGLKIIGRVEVPIQSTNLESEIAMIRHTEPDAFVFVGLWQAARVAALALTKLEWSVPAFGNSALMTGYLHPSWGVDWEGWTYADTVSDDNLVYANLVKQAGGAEPSPPVMAGAYDMGRLIAEGISRAPNLVPSAIKDGMERTKFISSASGEPGTKMGFGTWERSALKGEFLVLRQWRGGKSVQVRVP
jgi:branched-chain amino acid transport system substrate-binding protein